MNALADGLIASYPKELAHIEKDIRTRFAKYSAKHQDDMVSFAWAAFAYGVGSHLSRYTSTTNN